VSSAASLPLLSRRGGGELVREARRQRTLRGELRAHAAVWLFAANALVLQTGLGGLRTPEPWLNSLVVALVAAVPLLIVWHRGHAPRDGLAVLLLRLLRLAVVGFFALPLVALIVVIAAQLLFDWRWWVRGIVPVALGVGVLVWRLGRLRTYVRQPRHTAFRWFAARLLALILLSLGWCSALLIDRRSGSGPVPYRGAEYALVRCLGSWEIRREQPLLASSLRWSVRVRSLQGHFVGPDFGLGFDRPERLCVVDDQLFIESLGGRRRRAD